MAFDSNTYYAITSSTYPTKSLTGTSGGVFISTTKTTETDQQWQLFPFNSTVYIMRTVESMTRNAYLSTINSGPALPQMIPAVQGDNSIFWTLTPGSGGAYVLSSGKLGNAFHLEVVTSSTLNVVSGSVGDADEFSFSPIGSINDDTFSSVSIATGVTLAPGAAATTNLIAAASAASAAAAQAGTGSSPSVSASPAPINTPTSTLIQASPSPEQVSSQAVSTPTSTFTPTPQTIDSESATPIATSDTVTSSPTSVIPTNTFIAESALSASSSPDSDIQLSNLDTNTVFTVAPSNSILGSSSTSSNFVTTTNTLSSPTSSYTSTTTLLPISTTSTGLSTGAKAGIAISILCLILIILTFIFFLLRRRRHNSAATPKPDNLELAEKPHFDSTPTETQSESTFTGKGDIKRSETLTKHPAHRDRECSCPEHENTNANDNAPEIARPLSLSTQERTLHSNDLVSPIAELESPLSLEDTRLLGLGSLGGRFAGLNRERLSRVHEMEGNVPVELSAERNSGIPYWAKPPPEEMMGEGEGEWEHSMSDGGSVWGLEEYVRNSIFKDREPNSAAALQGSRLRQEVSREEGERYDGKGYGGEDGQSLYDSEDYTSEDEEKDIHEKEKVRE